MRDRDREDRSFRGGDARHGRQRSRSPDRLGRVSQHGAVRNFGELHGSGMGRDSVGGRTGNDSEISNPVNLLLNLSQMLSCVYLFSYLNICLFRNFCTCTVVGVAVLV